MMGAEHEGKLERHAPSGGRDGGIPPGRAGCCHADAPVRLRVQEHLAMRNGIMKFIVLFLFMGKTLMGAEGGQGPAGPDPKGPAAHGTRVYLIDTDKSVPVLNQLYVGGALGAFNANVHYQYGPLKAPSPADSINISSAPVISGDTPAMHFTALSSDSAGQGIKAAWDLPRDGAFDRSVPESVSFVLDGMLSARRGNASDMLSAFPLASEKARLTEIAYGENDAGSFISGYTVRIDAYPPNRTHFWRALGELVGLNVIGEIQYLTNLDANTDDWKYPLTLNGFRRKMADGAELDANNFATNAFGHLYSGSLYYTAGRSNGYGFYSSTLFALGGSLMWEYIGEFKEQASANDIIFTGLGGSILGEGLTQISLYIERNFHKSLARDIVVLIITPLRILNRYIDVSYNSSYKINIMFMNPAEIALETLAPR